MVTLLVGLLLVSGAGAWMVLLVATGFNLISVCMGLLALLVLSDALSGRPSRR